jgi:porin
MVRIFILSAAVTLFFHESVNAADTAPSPPGPDRLLSLDSKTLTGDWTGFRRALDDRGVRVNLFLNHQYEGIARGGLPSKRDDRSSASTDAFVSLDLERMKLLPDADVLLHLQSNWGRGINLISGSLYDVNDDADGDLRYHVAQLWFRQHLFERRAALTLGFLDFQTIVDRNAYANSEDKQFWNQALDNNPLVPLAIGLGVWLEVKPVKWYSLQLGVSDAQSVLYKPGFSTAFHDEAWFMGYAENDFRVALPSSRGLLPGNYRVGMVYDPRRRTPFSYSEFDRRPHGDDYGAFVSVDQLVFRERTEDEQGLGVFGRFGYRTPATNRIARFWSAGVSYTGLVPLRDRDVLGLGVAFERSSRLYRSRVDDGLDNETAYELYYAIRIAEWLVITPDVQYIDNPGAHGDVGRTIVAGVRTRVSF